MKWSTPRGVQEVGRGVLGGSEALSTLRPMKGGGIVRVLGDSWPQGRQVPLPPASGSALLGPPNWPFRKLPQTLSSREHDLVKQKEVE